MEDRGVEGDKMKWIKLWTEESLKGSVIAELDATEKGIWFTLLLLAGSSLSPGVVEIAKGRAYPNDYLIDHYVRCDKEKFEETIRKLTQLGMIKILSDHRIKITNWNKYQTRYEKYYKKGPKKTNSDSGGIHMPDRIEEDNIEFPKEIQEEMKDIFVKCWKKEKKSKYKSDEDQETEEDALQKIYKVCLKRNPIEPLKFFEDRVVVLFKTFDLQNITILAHYLDYDTTLKTKEEK